MVKEFAHCAYCGRKLNVTNDLDSQKEEDHVIPRVRGGCECEENKVDVCRGCNRAKGDMTPLEYYSWHEKGPFDYGGWTLAEKQHFLLQAGYWEVLARGHLWEAHRIRATFVSAEGS